MTRAIPAETKDAQGNAPAPGTFNVAARPSDLVVELEDTLKLHLDVTGRWMTFRYGSDLWRRALDGSVWSVRASKSEPPLRAEDGIHEEVRLAALRVAGALEASPPERVHWAGGRAERGFALDVLGRAANWDVGRYRDEQRRFLSAYPEPVRVLPPERMCDVVVLPATGCPHGRCEFCAFYRDSQYRVLDEAAFERHLHAVKELFGVTLSLRSGLFLGGANAVALSQRRLALVLSQTIACFGRPARGIGAFWDPDHSPARGSDAWRALEEAGLSALYVGLETGVPALRERLGKSPDVDVFVERVRAAKRACLRVGVIVLSGLDCSPEAHAVATSAAVTAMQLSEGDRVYISLLEGASEARGKEQSQMLRASLQGATAASVAPYRMNGFQYFA